ncbi:hypothetical protein OJF2_40940 [Aquisphaera giovannonii]|uniref:DUF1264 domain-containing protein n=1 Tax=Aquisphaera giovannonii TaxID=406548 RepID=A0A5B9W6F0_9BACT|nr:DUF1264 domain-containing protein [Aquisphaera giovannonii]QEH35541.1 hypothetical protein OJF2_40940 [Aquisphaera giovannonii]
MRAIPRTIARTHAALLLVGLGGFLAGLIAARGGGEALARAQDHAKATRSGVKAPVEEVLHCPLAFAGVHLEKAEPSRAQVAYHFCKPVHDGLSQCLLYDGTGPDARLIGVEYLVGAATYDAMPAEEKAYWHDHHFEVDSGLLRSLTQAGDEEKRTLAKVRTLYGKITHTWSRGEAYPEGPPRLFWAVTGEAPFLPPPAALLPAEVRPASSPARP